MKKYHLYLWIIALAGLITSCSRDEAAGPQNDASNRVRIGASIDQALQTRAASVSIPANHKLRYVLEVWDTEAEPACIYRDEKATTEATAVAFEFILTEAGNYKALLWADFVPDSETGIQVNTPNTYTHYADHHYLTNDAKGLKAVTLANSGTQYRISDDTRDAFFACIPIEKKTGAFEENVELKRPFGQINVIEKNTNLLAKVKSLTIKINVPDQFDVETGTPSGKTNIISKVSTLPTATADRKANLFYDYIFAPATGQTTLDEIGMEFESSDAHVSLPEYKIPANMPAVRNKRTNISGSILQANSNDAKLTVSVSDAWTLPDDKQDLDVPAARTLLDNCKTSGSGDNAEDYTYTISTAEQLTALSTLAQAQAVITDCTKAQYRRANYVLDADIDLENKPWTPIDNFPGNFDGRGHAIRNMNVSIQSTESYEVHAGLFEFFGGKVSNLIVEGTVAVSGAGTCYAGGICGRLAGTIEYCRFNGTVSSTTSNSNSWNYAGGITGTTVGVPIITGCIANAKVTISGGNSNNSGAGGLAGRIYGTNCIYSAWNSDSNNGGTADMIGKNTHDNGSTGTGNNGFTSISGLNNLLSGINSGASGSTYTWEAGAQDTDYPVLKPRK